MPAKNQHCLGGLDEGWATLVLQGPAGTPKPVKQEHFEAVVLKKVGDKLCWKVYLQEQDTPSLKITLNIYLTITFG